MGWMMDRYSTIRRQIIRGVVTGKPLTLGGSQGRDTATSTGAFYVIQWILPKFNLHFNLNPQQTTVAIQGFGNAGATLAELLFDAGYKVVAVSDSQGGIYAPGGLDIPSIRQYKNSSREIKAVYCRDSVCDIVEHQTITNQELLALDVDVLIPAALENQITLKNAADIKAKYIFEVANGPINSAADKILLERNIQIVPDILVNAGGVTVSYFEWVQNRNGFYWTLEEVNQKLKTKMEAETAKVWQIAENLQVDLRTAAYVHGLNRLGEAMDAKGTRDYYSNARQ
jgi:glutamate dehydrogenase (NADP+)